MLLLTTKAEDIAIHVDDWPRCHVCDMPVEKFNVTDTGDALILMAACHGKIETVEISGEVLDFISEGLAIIGPAFSNRR